MQDFYDDVTVMTAVGRQGSKQANMEEHFVLKQHHFPSLSSSCCISLIRSVRRRMLLSLSPAVVVVVATLLITASTAATARKKKKIEGKTLFSLLKITTLFLSVHSGTARTITEKRYRNSRSSRHRRHQLNDDDEEYGKLMLLRPGAKTTSMPKEKETSLAFSFCRRKEEQKPKLKLNCSPIASAAAASTLNAWLAGWGPNDDSKCMSPSKRLYEDAIANGRERTRLLQVWTASKHSRKFQHCCCLPECLPLSLGSKCWSAKKEKRNEWIFLWESMPGQRRQQHQDCTKWASLHPILNVIWFVIFMKPVRCFLPSFEPCFGSKAKGQTFNSPLVQNGWIGLETQFGTVFLFSFFLGGGDSFAFSLYWQNSLLNLNKYLIKMEDEQNFVWSKERKKEEEKCFVFTKFDLIRAFIVVVVLPFKNFEFFKYFDSQRF